MNVIRTGGGSGERENVKFSNWMYNITSGTGAITYTPEHDCSLFLVAQIWANMNISGGNMTSSAKGFQTTSKGDGGQLSRVGVIPNAKKGQAYTINVSGISGAGQGFRIFKVWAEIY